MENQHRKITGYRELTEQEIAGMNTAKQAEQDILEFIEMLEKGELQGVSADPRWLAIAKTDLQKGFMALGRSIARPDGY